MDKRFLTQLAETGSYRSDVETRHKLLSMPLLQFPADYAAVVGVNEKTAYEHSKLPNFPPARTIGRQQFIRTSDLLNWMMAE